MALDQNIGMVTAYAYAVSKGYTGTEEEFAQAMANAGITLESITEAVDAFINITVPSAVQSVTTEGNTQVTRVTDTGTAQVNTVNIAGGTNVAAVNTAGDTNVSAVNSAGSTQVGNVNTAGTTQVGNVNTAGSTQVGAVQAKGQEVINSIPSDYTALSDDVEDLKSSISQTGTPDFKTNGYILNDGKLYTNGGVNDRYTDYIRVKKGNVIDMFAKGNTNTNAYSFYTDKSESSYVEGAANDTALHLTYTVPQDGYIRFCIIASESQLIATSINIYTNTDVYIDELRKLNASGKDILPYAFRFGCWVTGWERIFFSTSNFCTMSMITVSAPMVIYVKENLRCDWDLVSDGSLVTTYRITSANSPYTLPAGTYYVNVTKTAGGDVTLDDIHFGMTTITDVEKGIEDLTARVDGLAAGTTNIGKFKNLYRYMAVSFMNVPYFASNNMVVLGSNDLRTFDLLAKKGIYACQKTHTDGNNTGVNALRDPAVIKIGEWFYITYTVISGIKGNVIGMCKTKDFTTFVELDNLTINVTGKTYTEIWAPDWYREGNDIYIVATCIATEKTYETVISKYDVENHSLAQGTVLTNLSGIDYHIYHTDGKYYAVGGNYRIYECDTLTGTYTQVSNNLQGGCEGATLVKLDNGKWRLYRQEVYAERGQAYMIYQDADSLESETWSSEKYVVWTPEAEAYAKEVADSDNPVGYYYHWTIYDFNMSNDNNNNFVS